MLVERYHTFHEISPMVLLACLPLFIFYHLPPPTVPPSMQCLFLAIFAACIANVSCSCKKFSITSEDDYEACWEVLGHEVELNLTVQTEGWIGFGIGDDMTGGMLGADVLTIEENEVVDRFTNGSYTTPARDCSQDWRLVSHSVVGGYTRCTVRRGIEAVDPLDRSFSQTGFTRIIISYSANHSTVLDYHGENRLMDTITLLPTADNNPPATPVNEITITLSNHTIPLSIPVSFCQHFDISDFADLQSEIWITRIQVSGSLYSQLEIFSCRPSSSSSSPSPDISVCGDSYLQSANCSELLYYWRGGDRTIRYPLDTGIQFNTTNQHVVAKVTYDDKRQRDSSDSDADVSLTMRILNNATAMKPMSIISVGNPSGNGDNNIIKGNVVQNRCSSQCTSELKEPVKVFGIHLATSEEGGNKSESSQVVVMSKLDGLLLQVDYQTEIASQTKFVNWTLRPGDEVTVYCDIGALTSKCGAYLLTYQQSLSICHTVNHSEVCRGWYSHFSADGTASLTPSVLIAPTSFIFGNFTASCVPKSVYSLSLDDIAVAMLFPVFFFLLVGLSCCLRKLRPQPPPTSLIDSTFSTHDKELVVLG
eukprot:TRINITY_DN6090_c1_g1_i1.p1 TRINITY_DN6090_c1_g1~~TRINITY_DN6090_c1_g1_i1.p1  ORF type:complete len:592 (+),score=59.99 TRINITY_DN6090_c1_g1_i1:951-2726(+)